MPKKHGDLFPRIVEFSNLESAYISARKGKRNRVSVAEYAVNLEENLINLQNHLMWGTWTPGPARRFTIREPKRRDIQAPPFEDRIVHHALVKIVEPIFERRFIHHSYACRKTKGAQKAVRAVQRQVRMARRNCAQPYALKADVSAYFASVRHDVLGSLIASAIKDRDVLDLWGKITAGYECDGIGLPVGALTSQLSANIVMDALDHAVVDDAGVGARYVRYMDDIVVICADKPSATAAMDLVSRAATSLGLSMNPKTRILPTQCGIDFCGYRIWATHILPRKRNIKKARRALRTMVRQFARGEIDLEYIRIRISSMLAYAKHCKAHNSITTMLNESIFTRRNHE
jgi:hypothetical protein